MSSVRCSVVIPAHNEQAVIGRTLNALLDGAAVGEFEVIVVCNGCTDQTAEVVRRQFPQARLIELLEASKTAALNAGLATATGKSVLLLDADIELPCPSARLLVAALQPPRKLAAIGRMNVDLEGVSWWVRAFYRVWLLHPYLENGKFAAAIGLSREAVELIWPIPAVTADDTYLRRRISRDHVASVHTEFTVRPPRSIATLVRVRSRSYRGTAQLSAHAPIGTFERYDEFIGLVKKLSRRADLWLCLPIYLFVNTAALLLARRSTNGWERDLTTRTQVPEVS